MARRIIWSRKAKEERFAILQYWSKRNKSKTYSGKLDKKFCIVLQYIADNNYLGKATSDPSVRVTVCGEYLIFYDVSVEVIYILAIFDSRRNPDDIKLKK